MILSMSVTISASARDVFGLTLLNLPGISVSPRPVQQRSTATPPTLLASVLGQVDFRLAEAPRPCCAEFGTMRPSDQVNVYEVNDQH